MRCLPFADPSRFRAFSGGYFSRVISMLQDPDLIGGWRSCCWQVGERESGPIAEVCFLSLSLSISLVDVAEVVRSASVPGFHRSLDGLAAARGQSTLRMEEFRWLHGIDRHFCWSI